MKILVLNACFVGAVFLEEYGPMMHYVKGPENVLADAYSRVPRRESMVGKNMPIANNSDNEPELESFYSILDQPELFDCLLNLPELNVPSENPLNMEWIRTRQQADADLQQAAVTYSDRYVTKTFKNNVQVLCYVRPGDDSQRQWKIALAKDMVERTIRWYHQVLGHPGQK